MANLESYKIIEIKVQFNIIKKEKFLMLADFYKFDLEKESVTITIHFEVLQHLFASAASLAAKFSKKFWLVNTLDNDIVMVI